MKKISKKLIAAILSVAILSGVGVFAVENELTYNPNYYNVQIFGAIPDDGVDDTQAFKNVAGGVIYVPEGEYIIKSTIAVGNTKLIGAGSDKTIITADFDDPMMPIINTGRTSQMEQRKIIQNATRRNKLKSGGTDVNETIEAEGNLQDVIELLANLRKNREPLLHCSVFIELKAKNMDALKELQSEIAMELTRSKISVDRLTLRQKEGFLSVLPVGANQFGAQYERVLPASSAANLYPFNFSGKTDPRGIYIGRDKFGTNILVDFDRRAEDKTTSNILILGNSGQGKSYLLKLILTNLRESGKQLICLDPESEYEEICSALGGCYIDFLSGEYTINPLEPKAWNDSTDDIAPDAPAAFKKATRLSQHIASVCYKRTAKTD